MGDSPAWIEFYQRLEARHPENSAERNRDLAKRIVRICGRSCLSEENDRG